ncbi:hypothetical protein SAMN02982919_01661 [Giesbergeria anulus]|uniref:Uncharacterized protein n=1 Tax=Giesbergeria anulus TaxID=180197 RepID=A0A1H9KUA9_9BURK|nr:hypothetical protein SAMN02982919_01661 [Giesbergeria anulus]
MHYPESLKLLRAESSSFVCHLCHPVRHFSALNAYRLQQAFLGIERVPPRSPGQPHKQHSASQQQWGV